MSIALTMKRTGTSTTSMDFDNSCNEFLFRIQRKHKHNNHRQEIHTYHKSTNIEVRTKQQQQQQNSYLASGIHQMKRIRMTRLNHAICQTNLYHFRIFSEFRCALVCVILVILTSSTRTAARHWMDFTPASGTQQKLQEDVTRFSVWQDQNQQQILGQRQRQLFSTNSVPWFLRPFVPSSDSTSTATGSTNLHSNNDNSVETKTKDGTPWWWPFGTSDDDNINTSDTANDDATSTNNNNNNNIQNTKNDDVYPGDDGISPTTSTSHSNMQNDDVDNDVYEPSAEPKKMFPTLIPQYAGPESMPSSPIRTPTMRPQQKPARANRPNKLQEADTMQYITVPFSPITIQYYLKRNSSSIMNDKYNDDNNESNWNTYVNVRRLQRLTTNHILRYVKSATFLAYNAPEMIQQIGNLTMTPINQKEKDTGQKRNLKQVTVAMNMKRRVIQSTDAIETKLYSIKGSLVLDSRFGRNSTRNKSGSVQEFVNEMVRFAFNNTSSQQQYVDMLHTSNEKFLRQVVSVQNIDDAQGSMDNDQIINTASNDNATRNNTNNSQQSFADIWGDFHNPIMIAICVGIGIVTGGFVVFIVMLYCHRNRRNRKKSKHGETDSTNNSLAVIFDDEVKSGRQSRDSPAKSNTKVSSPRKSPFGVGTDLIIHSTPKITTPLSLESSSNPSSTPQLSTGTKTPGGLLSIQSTSRRYPPRTGSSQKLRLSQQFDPSTPTSNTAIFLRSNSSRRSLSRRSGSISTLSSDNYDYTGSNTQTDDENTDGNNDYAIRRIVSVSSMSMEGLTANEPNDDEKSMTNENNSIYSYLENANATVLHDDPTYCLSLDAAYNPHMIENDDENDAADNDWSVMDGQVSILSDPGGEGISIRKSTEKKKVDSKSVNNQQHTPRGLFLLHQRRSSLEDFINDKEDENGKKDVDATTAYENLSSDDNKGAIQIKNQQSPSPALLMDSAIAASMGSAGELNGTKLSMSSVSVLVPVVLSPPVIFTAISDEETPVAVHHNNEVKNLFNDSNITIIDVDEVESLEPRIDSKTDPLNESNVTIISPDGNLLSNSSKRPIFDCTRKGTFKNAHTSQESKPSSLQTTSTESPTERDSAPCDSLNFSNASSSIDKSYLLTSTRIQMVCDVSDDQSSVSQSNPTSPNQTMLCFESVSSTPDAFQRRQAKSLPSQCIVSDEDTVDNNEYMGTQSSTGELDDEYILNISSRNLEDSLAGSPIKESLIHQDDASDAMSYTLNRTSSSTTVPSFAEDLTSKFENEDDAENENPVSTTNSNEFPLNDLESGMKMSLSSSLHSTNDEQPEEIIRATVAEKRIEASGARAFGRIQYSKGVNRRINFPVSDVKGSQLGSVNEDDTKVNKESAKPVPGVDVPHDEIDPSLHGQSNHSNPYATLDVRRGRRLYYQPTDSDVGSLCPSLGGGGSGTGSGLDSDCETESDIQSVDTSLFSFKSNPAPLPTTPITDVSLLNNIGRTNLGTRKGNNDGVDEDDDDDNDLLHAIPMPSAYSNLSPRVSLNGPSQNAMLPSVIDTSEGNASVGKDGVDDDDLSVSVNGSFTASDVPQTITMIDDDTLDNERYLV